MASEQDLMMSITPNWTFVAALLVVGICGGSFVTHGIMESRIEKMNAGHAEELRVREVQRAKDEAVARAKEQTLTAQIATIEQARTNEVATVRTDAAALIERLRNQAASKPTNPGRVPQAATACEAAARTVVPERVGTDLVRLAQRADELRSALGACQQAYDSVAR